MYSDKSLVFKMFKAGRSITDVVIETKLEFDYVTKAHKEFLESEDKVTVPKWFYNEIMFLAGYPGYSVTLENATKVMYELIESDQILMGCFSSCSVCGLPIELEEESMENAKKNLRVLWHHEKCA